MSRLLTPELIDSHVHFVEGGRYLKNVPLRDAATMREVSRRVARCCSLPVTKRIDRWCSSIRCWVFARRQHRGR
jgi:hypothetical protein